jgi:hypothetical protein
LTESDIFNRFVLFTKERRISFLFQDKGLYPFAVKKSGHRADIGTEYQNHVRAKELLGNKVPDIWGFETSEETAFFYLEYVPEIFLSNVVAHSFFNKKKLFVKEVLSMLDFYLSVFTCFLYKNNPVSAVDNTLDVGKLFSEISAGFTGRKSQTLSHAFALAEKSCKPMMLQHGDFCIRNILYGGNQRKVLIDWEDMNSSTLPLVDYMMLFISIQALFEQLFHDDPAQLFQMDEIKAKVDEIKNKIISMLDLDRASFHKLAFLSTALLCRQNLSKDRQATAQLIFNEMEKQAENFSDITI